MEDDKFLVTDLKLGCEKSFELLFIKYGVRLYGFSMGYLRSSNEVEELVQDVFAKIWENRTELKPDRSFRSYIFTIALNLIKKSFIEKERKQNYHRYMITTGKNSGWDVSTLSQLEYNFTMERLYGLIEEMPQRRRMIFIKRRFDYLSVKEIAKEMAISPKTVENQMTHALKYMRLKIEETPCISKN